MSGLVEKVKERVRGRSLSRRPDENAPAGTTTGNYSQNQTDGDAQLSSPTTSAWHVHKGARNSTEARDIPPVPHLDDRYTYKPNSPQTNSYPAAPTNVVDTRHDNEPLRPHTTETARPGNTLSSMQGGDTDKIPTHSSSGHKRVPSEGQGQHGAQYPYTVPRRKESLPQNRAPRVSLDQKRSQQRKSTEQQMPPQHMNTNEVMPATVPSGPVSAGSLPNPQPSNDLGTEIDQALASLSVSSGVTQPVARTKQGDQVVDQPEHVRLPAGFQLGQSEHTVIDTQWKPAVTHDHIYHEKTEIVREAITRDIHVHHYYTYIQPIKVVEVLPAKHYRIDPKTGIKIEIPAPRGWVMPKHLQPGTEDTSGLAGWTRHYLVNEQYPHGVLESPPPSPKLNGANGHVPAYYNGAA